MATQADQTPSTRSTTPDEEPKNSVWFPVEGGAIESYVHEDHKRGKNWAAILEGPNAARMSRTFLRGYDRTYDSKGLEVGMVLEFGADYYSSSGTKRPRREYFVVVAIDEDGLKALEFNTAAQAIKARNALYPEIAKALLVI